MLMSNKRHCRMNNDFLLSLPESILDEVVGMLSSADWARLNRTNKTYLSRWNSHAQETSVLLASLNIGNCVETGDIYVGVYVLVSPYDYFQYSKPGVYTPPDKISIPVNPCVIGTSLKHVFRNLLRSVNDRSNKLSHVVITRVERGFQGNLKLRFNDMQQWSFNSIVNTYYADEKLSDDAQSTEMKRWRMMMDIMSNRPLNVPVEQWICNNGILADVAKFTEARLTYPHVNMFIAADSDLALEENAVVMSRSLAELYNAVSAKTSSVLFR